MPDDVRHVDYDMAVAVVSALVSAILALAGALAYAVKWARAEQTKRDELHEAHLEFSKEAVSVLEKNVQTRSSAREAHERREQAFDTRWGWWEKATRRIAEKVGADVD